MEGNAWKRYELVHPKEKNGNIMLSPAADTLDSNVMFDTLLYYVRKRSVVGASSGETCRASGTMPMDPLTCFISHLMLGCAQP